MIDKQFIKKLLYDYNNKQYESVLITCLELIKQYPKNSFFFNLTGLCFQKKKNYLKAKDNFQKSIEVEPTNIAAKNNLGNTEKFLKNFNEAEVIFKESIKANPSYVNTFINYGNLKRELRNTKQAIELYKKALKIDENHIVLNLTISSAYISMGSFEEAKIHLKKVISVTPGDIMARKMLDDLMEDKNSKKEHIKFLENKLKKKAKNQNEEIELFFSLSKAYEDKGNYEKAFFFMEKGNNIKRKKIDYSIDEEQHFFEEIKKLFKDCNFNNTTKKIFNDKKIIFILGMPRSGTTLTEQILSTHKNVYGCGELSFLRNIILENFYSQKSFSKKDIENIIIENIESISNKYIDLLKNYKIDEYYVIDKAPLNFQWIGFIKIFFPQSKIIHCKRDPKDNCLSLYKNSFASNDINWSYNKEELIKYYELYEDLMNFWKSKFPDFIYDIDYEEIVADQETVTKKLLKFCELSWDPNCLEYYEYNKKQIDTFSTIQARKPIYKSSVKLFNKYSKYLKLFSSRLKNS